MGVLSRLLSGSLRAETPGPFDDFWYNPVGTLTPSGMRVDTEGAQKLSAWYRGRDILATVLAMLPLQVFERLPNDGGSNVARQHPLYEVLHDNPNEWQDSFQWRREKMFHIIDHGWAYDFIRPGPRGPVDHLQPIHPTLVTPKQIPTGARRGRYVFDVRDERTGQTTDYSQDEIFYLRGAGGKGILDYARSSLGTALATESYAANIFGRGPLNGGVIENPGLLDAEASRRMALSFVTKVGEWHLPKVLEQGSKFVESKMTPEDAQMLLSRKFTVDDIARWLGIPRMMLENSDPSFGNAEQFSDDFIKISMGGWLALWEFGINTQLMMNPRRFFAQFKRQAFVRGNLAARSQAQVAYVNAGIYTVDEVRAQEDMNKRGGKADELREPQNITGKPMAPDAGAQVEGGDQRVESATVRSADSPFTSARSGVSGLTPPPAPPVPAAPPSSAQAEAIAAEVAARLLRKEVSAVQKAAVRHAGDENAFVAEVTAFYVKHVGLVQEALHVPREKAERYCAEQAHQVINQGWLDALETWRAPDYAAGLAGLALEEGQA